MEIVVFGSDLIIVTQFAPTLLFTSFWIRPSFDSIVRLHPEIIKSRLYMTLDQKRVSFTWKGIFQFKTLSLLSGIGKTVKRQFYSCAAGVVIKWF